MAKKPRDEAPNPNSVSNRDIIQRLNFLYQASVYLNGMPEPIDSARSKRVLSTADLSRSYIKTMKAVGQKSTTKMDPAVKRTLCKGCNIVLIPGSTATVRVKSMRSHGHGVTYTCTSCRTSKRIPAPPTLVPYGDPESTTALEVAAPAPSHSMDASAPTTDEPMGILPLASAHAEPETPDSRQRNRRKKRKPPVPRLPPLFARDVGHVVFVGNERLEVES